MRSQHCTTYLVYYIKINEEEVQAFFIPQANDTNRSVDEDYYTLITISTPTISVYTTKRVVRPYNSLKTLVLSLRAVLTFELIKIISLDC